MNVDVVAIQSAAPVNSQEHILTRLSRKQPQVWGTGGLSQSPDMLYPRPLLVPIPWFSQGLHPFFLPSLRRKEAGFIASAIFLQ